MQMRETFIDVLGAPLHIYAWGNPSAKHQMLYWHGRGGSGLSINEAAPVLAEHYDAYVVSLDAPGFGQSTAREVSAYLMPQLANLAKALADSLNMSSFFFVGHSWGGMVGCHVATHYPEHVKGLMLLDTGYMNPEDRGYTAEEAIEEAIKLYQSYQFDDWEAYLDEEKKHLSRWTEDLSAALRATMQENNEKIIPILTSSLIKALERAYTQHPPSSTYPRLKETHVPIRLLAATLPQSFQPTRERLISRFQASVPQLQVKYIPETSHDMPSILGSDLAHLIGEWMTRDEV
jgi:pimeloyl-ACP methyl ester carboxylesterase